MIVAFMEIMSTKKILTLMAMVPKYQVMVLRYVVKYSLNIREIQINYEGNTL